jgi:hypothetical protein
MRTETEIKEAINKIQNESWKIGNFILLEQHRTEIAVLKWVLESAEK